MDVRTRKRDDLGVGVVTVSGEVDLWTVESLKDSLSACLDDGAHRLVVDLTEVDFIDSTGIGVLVAALRSARQAGGDLGLVVTHPHVSRILEITSLDKVFLLSEDVDGAAALVAASTGSDRP
jgi:anti-sigma B factor antagonist